MQHPPKGLGGVELPPRDYRSMIEQLRDEHRLELERLEAGLLALERRTFEQSVAIDNLSAELERAERDMIRIQRDSWVDDRIEDRVRNAVIEALPKPMSEMPDGTTEVRTAGGTRVRAPWWVALALALLVAITVAMWQAKTLTDIVRMLR